jgi:hypothetical protein
MSIILKGKLKERMTQTEQERFRLMFPLRNSRVAQIFKV